MAQRCMFVKALWQMTDKVITNAHKNKQHRKERPSKKILLFYVFLILQGISS